MTPIYVNHNWLRIELYRSILETAGIPTTIRMPNSVPGVLDPSAPVLCVLNDADFDQAASIIASLSDQIDAAIPDWKCPRCGESVPCTFGQCWSCEELRPNSGEYDLWLTA